VLLEVVMSPSSPFDPSQAPPDAAEAPLLEGPPPRTREQLLADEEFAWQISNEDEDVGEQPIELEGTREPVHWPADAESVDYHHLLDTPDGEGFSLTGPVLRSLVQANHFQPVRNTLVVVGLRGCVLAGDDDHHDFTDTIACVEARPDHMSLRCTLVLWDTTQDRVAAFRGSTVPNGTYLTRYIRDRSPRSNMLLTGAYHYITGTHRGMPGALRMAQPSFRVLRPVLGKSRVELTRADRFDGPAAPPDNIHPAFRQASSRPAFGSAGCQTVQGSYSKSTGQRWGPWAVFQARAGLLEGTTRFDYVLLTGREARLAATHPDVDLWRLRFGSKGPAVRELQTRLGTGVDGDFGPTTQGAVLARQRELADDGLGDGIVSRAWMEGL